MLYTQRQTDNRGDTPLHAAACNGATACLLLLLQYGCAPDVRNKRNLRPIDLAAKRGHAAAEKVRTLHTH
jgi:ankyrin repeat protein